MVEPILLSWAALPDDGSGAQLHDVTRISTERDNEALLRELVGGYESRSSPELGDEADVGDSEARRVYGSHGDDRQVPPKAAAETSAAVFRGPCFGEQFHAARGVLRYHGIEDEAEAAVFGVLRRCY